MNRLSLIKISIVFCGEYYEKQKSPKNYSLRNNAKYLDLVVTNLFMYLYSEVWHIRFLKKHNKH